MNFHEDVSMRQVHQKLFYMLTGLRDKQPLLIQVPYSIGLGLGMILFLTTSLENELMKSLVLSKSKCLITSKT